MRSVYFNDIYFDHVTLVTCSVSTAPTEVSIFIASWCICAQFVGPVGATYWMCEELADAL